MYLESRKSKGEFQINGGICLCAACYGCTGGCQSCVGCKGGCMYTSIASY